MCRILRRFVVTLYLATACREPAISADESVLPSTTTVHAPESSPEKRC